MNNEAITGMSFNASLEQLEEQILRHQKQIRSLHFEIARRQMWQVSQMSRTSTDLSQGCSQAMKSPISSNPLNQQSSNLGKKPKQADPFQQPAAQRNSTLSRVNTLNQHGQGSFGQSWAQNGFGKVSPTRKAFGETISKKNPFGHPSESSVSFGQAKLFDSKQSRQQKRSFGHPSQESFGMEARQQSNAYISRQTAPGNPSVLTPGGRMLNKQGQFLGRVQFVPTEGFAVSIKRLGKAKFFDYRTVEECHQEWESK